MKTLFAASAALFVFSAPLHAQVSTWSGGSLANSNWDQSANWQSGAIPDGNTDMTFTGSLRTTNNNNFSENQISLNFLDFASGAAAFTLQGSACQITHPGGTNTITNHSTNLQTLDFDAAMSVQVAVTIDAISGDIRINNGLFLQAFQTNSADLTVTGSHNTTLAGVISEDTNLNPAGIIKNGTGTLFLLNNNTYSGGTFIDGGIIAVGSLNALGTGDVGIRGFNSDSTLETVGESPLTFNAGDSSHDFFMFGGTPLTILRMKVGGTNSGVNTDLMQVGNDAFLDGVLFVHKINNYMPAPEDRVTIINTGVASGTGVVGSGRFQSVQSDFPGLIQPDAEYFNQRVDVEFDLSPFTSVSGLTFNQNAVAVALDQAFASACLPGSTFAILGAQPIAALPHIFDLIAPEELAAVYEISFTQATVRNSNLQRRMDDIHAGSNGYCGPVVEINPVEDKNVSKNVAAPMAPSPDNRWGIFIDGGGDFVVVGNDDENARGYQIHNGNFTVGADYRLLHNLAIGIYGGYDGSDTSLVGRGRITMGGSNVGAFATWWCHGFYVDATGGGNWNSYDIRRDAFLGQAHGSTDGTEVNGMGAIGYDWKHDFGKPGCLNIGPLVSIQYTNVDLNGYTEQGSLIPLRILDQSEDSVRLSAGGRASLDVRSDHGLIVRPEVRAAWLHEFNDRVYPINATFAGCPDVFTVHGPATGRDAALIGAGVTLLVTPTFSIFGHYDGIVSRDNYNSYSVNGGIGFGF